MFCQINRLQIFKIKKTPTGFLNILYLNKNLKSSKLKMLRLSTEGQIKIIFNYSINSPCPNINKFRLISVDIEKNHLRIRKLRQMDMGLTKNSQMSGHNARTLLKLLSKDLVQSENPSCQNSPSNKSCDLDVEDLIAFYSLLKQLIRHQTNQCLSFLLNHILRKYSLDS